MEIYLKCPQCKSESVKQGNVLGYSDAPCMASLFRPDVKAAIVTSEGLAISHKFYACAECGLLWQTLPEKSLERLPNYERDNKLL